jgi:hypothetical protein
MKNDLDRHVVLSCRRIYPGTISSPSPRPLLRTRSSKLSNLSPATAPRPTITEAKWIASSVRIGSPGNGCCARSTISGETRKTCQCAAAATRCARRSAASASVNSFSVAARNSTRWHSMSVRSEATMISAAARQRRTSVAAGSSSSQASTALDSAYRFTAGHALHREAVRRCAYHGADAAVPRTNSHHRRSLALQDPASRAPAGLPARMSRLGSVREVRLLPLPHPDP